MITWAKFRQVLISSSVSNLGQKTRKTLLQSAKAFAIVDRRLLRRTPPPQRWSGTFGSATRLRRLPTVCRRGGVEGNRGRDPFCDPSCQKHRCRAYDRDCDMAPTD